MDRKILNQEEINEIHRKLTDVFLEHELPIDEQLCFLAMCFSGTMAMQEFSDEFFLETCDMMFENLVRDYSNAEKIYGEGMLRFASGYDTDTIKKNI